MGRRGTVGEAVYPPTLWWGAEGDSFRFWGIRADVESMISGLARFVKNIYS
jgi:hypothetical protein